MSQTAQNKKQKHSLCKPSEALVSLLTNYAKSDVDFAFVNLEELFFQWLETEWANEQKAREDFIYSFKIIRELGVIVKGISEKKLLKLHKQMQLELKNVS